MSNIVLSSKNLESYLYRHIRLDTNEIFYIGIGRGHTFRRAYQKISRNRHWKSIVKTIPYRVEIVFCEISWEEACDKEKEFIKLYGRRDLKLGSLVNLTDGGEGAYGRVIKKESLEKFKNSMSKNPHPMLGKTHTEEAKRKISEASRRMVRDENFCKKISEGTKGKSKTKTEILLKMRERYADGGKLGRKVVDTKTGIIYHSISNAARLLNIPIGRLAKYLSGYRKNKTSLIYLKNE